MKANLAELADTFGFSLPTMRSYVRKGMPYEQEGTNGTEWVFDTAAVYQWLLAKDREDNQPPPEEQDPNANTAKELQRRKLQAETEIVEIDLAKKKGLVVLVEDAVACNSDSVATVRAQLLNLLRRAAPLIVGEPTKGQ